MTQRREMRDGVREAGRNVRGLGVFRLVKRCVCTFFFFFFFFEFRPDSAVSADTSRYGRYGPSRPDFGRVGPIQDLPRGTTQSDAARTRGLRRPCRVPPRRTWVRRPWGRIRASQSIPFLSSPVIIISSIYTINKIFPLAEV